MEFLLRRRNTKRLVRTLLLDSVISSTPIATVAKLLKLVNAFYYFMYYRSVPVPKSSTEVLSRIHPNAVSHGCSAFSQL